MSKVELQDSIIRSISGLSTTQQRRLLEIIHAMNAEATKSSPRNLLQFAGAIPKKQLDEMELAIQDCSKVDANEW